MKGTRVIRRFCILLAVACASCATAPRLDPPTLAVTRVSVDRLTGADARFLIVLDIANPNDRAVEVGAIDAKLAIEDIDVGTAHLASPVTLPARGRTTASIVAHADLAASLRATAQIAQRLADNGQVPPGVRYAVSGTAVVDGSIVLPFSRTGEFKLRMAGEKP